MVFDTFENWEQYAWPSERFTVGFEYLTSLAADTADGRYAIDGDDVFCMVETYQTTPAEGHEFEAHRVYADIQCLLAGEESILWAPTPELSVSKPYVDDIEFYMLAPIGTEIVLSPGRFCVLFPQDAHAPCIAFKQPSEARKAVVKVRLA